VTHGADHMAEVIPLPVERENPPARSRWTAGAITRRLLELAETGDMRETLWFRVIELEEDEDDVADRLMELLRERGLIHVGDEHPALLPDPARSPDALPAPLPRARSHSPAQERVVIGLTGATLEREGLEPLLDVRVATMLEASELTVLDRGCGALTDDARQLADAGAPLAPFERLVRDLGRIMRVDGELHKLQQLEDGGERRVVGFLDQTVVDLRAYERRGGNGRSPSAKEIGRRLRAPLHMLTMTTGLGALDYARAGAAIEAACAGIGRPQLLAAGVERELGRKNFAALTALLSHETRGADGKVGSATKTAEDARDHATA
jgi:hypothetical protein